MRIIRGRRALEGNQWQSGQRLSAASRERHVDLPLGGGRQCALGDGIDVLGTVDPRQFLIRGWQGFFQQHAGQS